MKRTLIFITVFCFFVFFIASTSFGNDNILAKETPLINQFIKNKLIKRKIAGDTLKTGPVFESYYENRDYSPIWSKKGKILTVAYDMVKSISSVSLEGLSPENYHYLAINSLLNLKKLDRKKINEEELADLELLLTDAFFSIGFHYLHGAIDLEGLKLRWYSRSDQEVLQQALNKAIEENKVRYFLSELLPNSYSYVKLRQALYEYKDKKDKVVWPQIPTLPKRKKIKKGDQDKRVVFLKQRFGILDSNKPVSLSEDSSEILLFDEELETAIIKFQKKNALLADGVVGYRTVAELNATIQDRIDQIKVNMDRIRYLQSIHAQSRYILVNIPDFWLNLYEDGKSILAMKVIVGMKKRPTPILSSKIEYLIFSPEWFVPDTILLEDKLSHIQEDPEFFKKHAMTVYEKTKSGGRGEEIDPSNVDWSQFDPANPDNVPYRVVQSAGSFNALGRVKFIFPNKHAVYLHDTPQKSLFGNVKRTFSSGCVRVEKPEKLAKMLLADKPEWDEEKIKEAMQKSKKKIVDLTEPIPIHITYITAWVDDTGELQFRDDIYNLDKDYKKIFFNH